MHDAQLKDSFCGSGQRGHRCRDEEKAMTTERDHDYRLGEDAGLRGAPLPSDGYSDPYSAHTHWQRVRGYEAGTKLRNSAVFRAGFARGKAALTAGDKDALQRAAYAGAAGCGGELGLDKQGYFYAVFGGELE